MAPAVGAPRPFPSAGTPGLGRVPVDAERVLDAFRRTRFGQARTGLPRSPRREKMADSPVASGGRPHNFGDSVVVEDMMNERLGAAACLPEEHEQALLVGRAWLPSVDGPALVALRDDGVYDVSEVAPTASALFELD